MQFPRRNLKKNPGGLDAEVAMSLVSSRYCVNYELVLMVE